MLVVAGRFEETVKRTFFDCNWQRIPIEYNYSPIQEHVDKPKNLEEEIAFAELLAKEMPFARIDFYEVEGKTYFGEITLYPDAGYAKFSPDEWNRTLGEWIVLPPIQQAAGSK